MRLHAWRAGGLFLAMFLAVGCGGGQSGDLPRAPASTGTAAPAAEKQEGKVKMMAPAQAAEKYKD